MPGSNVSKSFRTVQFLIHTYIHCGARLSEWAISPHFPLQIWPLGVVSDKRVQHKAPVSRRTQQYFRSAVPERHHLVCVNANWNFDEKFNLIRPCKNEYIDGSSYISVYVHVNVWTRQFEKWLSEVGQLGSPGIPKALASPKSASLMAPCWSISRFCGFKSRCRIRRWWQNRIPFVIWYMYVWRKDNKNVSL